MFSFDMSVNENIMFTPFKKNKKRKLLLTDGNNEHFMILYF